MRRVTVLFFLLLKLAIPAHASHTAVGIAIESGPNGRYTRQLLDGLYDRGLQATFLLRGKRIEEHRELTEQLFREGHEIAHRGYTGQSMTSDSRREISRQITDTEALLPQGCQPVLLCPPGGITDGIRQVAEARKLAILQLTCDPRKWEPGTTADSRVRDGDILYLRDGTQQAVEEALQILDQLLAADIRILPVTQLAKQRNIPLRPGQIYSRFSAET